MLGSSPRRWLLVVLVTSTAVACSDHGRSGTANLDKWATAFCAGQLKMSARVRERYGPPLDQTITDPAMAGANRRTLLSLDAAIIRADDVVDRATRAVGAPKITNGRQIQAVTLRMIGHNRQFFKNDARLVAALPTNDPATYLSARAALPHNWSDQTGNDSSETYRLDTSDSMTRATQTVGPCITLTGGND